MAVQATQKAVEIWITLAELPTFPPHNSSSSVYFKICKVALGLRPKPCKAESGLTSKIVRLFQDGT
jgi:hypothetical protein